MESFFYEMEKIDHKIGEEMENLNNFSQTN